MSTVIKKQYTTSLETAERGDIVRVLNDKLAVKTPQGLVDYVGFSVNNLKDKLERVKVAKQELALIEAETKAQIEYIKQEVATFLVANGIKKIEGDIVSSITLHNPKPTYNLHYTDAAKLIDMGYAKVSVDETAVKQAIKNGEIAPELAYLTQSLKPTSIIINKKRGA